MEAAVMGSPGAQMREAALESLRVHARQMAPVAAMQVRVAGYDGDDLSLEAPLEPNMNDKGGAFGGSMASVMTFAGWGLVTLRLHEAGMVADVFVADSAVRYLKPLYAPLHASARLSPGQSWDTFLAALSQRGRARIQVRARMLSPAEGPGSELMADLAGRYVAILKG
jgi:thioesterase domain-containing protein